MFYFEVFAKPLPQLTTLRSSCSFFFNFFFIPLCSFSKHPHCAGCSESMQNESQCSRGYIKRNRARTYLCVLPCAPGCVRAKACCHQVVKLYKVKALPGQLLTTCTDVSFMNSAESWRKRGRVGKKKANNQREHVGLGEGMVGRWFGVLLGA